MLSVIHFSHTLSTYYYFWPPANTPLNIYFLLFKFLLLLLFLLYIHGGAQDHRQHRHHRHQEYIKSIAKIHSKNAKPCQQLIPPVSNATIEAKQSHDHQSYHGSAPNYSSGCGCLVGSWNCFVSAHCRILRSASHLSPMSQPQDKSQLEYEKWYNV